MKRAMYGQTATITANMQQQTKGIELALCEFEYRREVDRIRSLYNNGEVLELYEIRKGIEAMQDGMKQAYSLAYNEATGTRIEDCEFVTPVRTAAIIPTKGKAIEQAGLIVGMALSGLVIVGLFSVVASAFGAMAVAVETFMLQYGAWLFFGAVAVFAAVLGVRSLFAAKPSQVQDFEPMQAKRTDAGNITVIINSTILETKAEPSK